MFLVISQSSHVRLVFCLWYVYIFNYHLFVTSCDQSVLIIYFFLIELWWNVLFYRLSHFFQVVLGDMGYVQFTGFWGGFGIFPISVVISPLSYLNFFNLGLLFILQCPAQRFVDFVYDSLRKTALGCFEILNVVSSGFIFSLIFIVSFFTFPCFFFLPNFLRQQVMLFI